MPITRFERFVHLSDEKIEVHVKACEGRRTFHSGKQVKVFKKLTIDATATRQVCQELLLQDEVCLSSLPHQCQHLQQVQPRIVTYNRECPWTESKRDMQRGGYLLQK